ncbi:MAG: hypothetical protein MJ220_02360 [Bacilli bacterium]|nr:hypothetical protein [Bacilli bacterium]
MSKSFKKIPIQKGSRHRSTLKDIKKLSRKIIRNYLKRQEDTLLQGNMSYKLQTLSIYKYLIEEGSLDFRYYEKDIGMKYSPADHRFRDLKDFEDHQKWLKKAKRHCYGK